VAVWFNEISRYETRSFYRMSAYRSTGYLGVQTTSLPSLAKDVGLGTLRRCAVDLDGESVKSKLV